MALFTSNFNSKRLYISLTTGAIGVLIIAVLNIFIYKLSYPEYKHKYEMENFWMNKVKSSKQFDMVFIGDSRCYRGIQPAVFEKELGLTAFNAGLSSGGHNMEIYNHISNNILSEPKGGGDQDHCFICLSVFDVRGSAQQ